MLTTDSEDLGATRVFRVGTWNMDHWKRDGEARRRAWSKLGELGLDAALLQEAVVPEDVDRATVVYRPIAGNRPWGNAVVSLGGAPLSEIQSVVTRYSSRSFSTLGTYPGTVITASCEVPDFGAVTLVSIYGMIDVYSQTTMLRIVADLIPVFDSPAGELVVLGGDFNLSTCGSRQEPEWRRYEAILNAVESLGLRDLAALELDRRPPAPPSCACGEAPGRHVATYRGKENGAPVATLDYLFATPALARRCRLLTVADEPTRGLSDHAPLIAEFDVSEPVGRTRWDQPSFLAMLGERHGSEVAACASSIFEWVARKHVELVQSGVRARLDRLPFSTGEGPEVWVQLDMADPEALQYTFSLRANGMVAIQFQYMRPPFASEAARSALASELRSLPGVDLDARTHGRPTFPLASLQDAECMQRFLAIWSRFVDESVRDRTPALPQLPV